MFRYNLNILFPRLTQWPTTYLGGWYHINVGVRERKRGRMEAWNLNCVGGPKDILFGNLGPHILCSIRSLFWSPPSNIASRSSKFQHTTFHTTKCKQNKERKKVGIDEKWFQYERWFFKEESIMQKTWRVSQRTKRKIIHNQKMCSHASLLAWLKISQHLFNLCFS